MKSEIRNPKSNGGQASRLSTASVSEQVLKNESDGKAVAGTGGTPVLRWISDLAIVLSLLTAFLSGCTTGGSHQATTLKGAYNHQFYMGVAVNEDQFTGKDQRGVAIVEKHYNSISPENALKWESIHPRPGPDGYNFGPADRYVEFGE